MTYDMTNILDWFRHNSMKANPGKFQFMIVGRSDDRCFILKLNVIEIRNTSEVELLRLNSKTARFKLLPLCRVRKCLTLEQAKLLENSFVNTQLG